jgi:uncharacterized surface protein with fasciclin (FAS1) repeats
MSNITQVVNTDKNMTTLKKGVHASDLDQLLSSTGPFTFFAPLDIAFAKLGNGVIENLLQPLNKTDLTTLLNCHIVKGQVKFDDLNDGDKLKTIEGKELTVSAKNGTVRINDATIQGQNLKATNGVIHTLDAVLKN